MTQRPRSVPDLPMKDERIILGVCAGIAAYKSPSIVRQFKDLGAEVRVVLTPATTNFVSLITFQAVSGYPVSESLWDRSDDAAMRHIELARWATQIIVAPATANTIARLAHGQADDLLTTLILASRAPVSLVPAMNHAMWTHPATQSNVDLLRTRGIDILGPANGPLAEGESGVGRMIEPTEIVLHFVQLRRILESRSVVITAGPTHEPIDPVRYIGNRSSGKMGYALARAAKQAGARVTLVSGPVSLPPPHGVTFIGVTTAEEMYRAVMSATEACDVFISAAAVADYRPAETTNQKIKKKDSIYTIALQPTRDILSSVSVSTRPNRPFCVGFAAETENIKTYALQKLNKKGLDMIVANQVGPDKVFGQDETTLSVFWKNGHEDLGRGTKQGLANTLVKLISEHLERRN